MGLHGPAKQWKGVHAGATEGGRKYIVAIMISREEAQRKHIYPLPVVSPTYSVCG